MTDIGEGALKVWNVINPPRKPVWIPVSSVYEALETINHLINKQLKMKSITSNAFGLCEWDGEEWTEWYNDEGQDVMDLIRKKDAQE